MMQQRTFFPLLTWVAIAGLFLFCRLPTQASTVEQADRQFSSVSRLLEQADAAFERNDLEDAHRLYGATLRAWGQFSENYPDFAPELVQFRMAYCRNQQANVRQRMARRPPPAPARQTEPTGQPAAAPTATAIIPAHLLDKVRQGDFHAVRQAARQMPADPAGFYLLAAAFLAENDLPAARILMEELLESHPGQAAAHYNLAQLLLREITPDIEQAREHYQRARELGAPRDEDLEIVINF